MAAATIPVVLNCRAGSAAVTARLLAGDGRFHVWSVEPTELRGAVRRAVQEGASRVVVCGGDGSVAAAAAELVGTRVELAVLPGGTWNNFARDHGIPLGTAEARELAAGGTSRPVDVGFVNDRLFLNTSSVGAYVSFVRRRERLERWLSYRLASFVAGLQLFVSLRDFALVIETEAVVQHYRTSLAFVGVGERELALPSLGRRLDGGRRGLHAIVVGGRAPARLLALALAAVAGGVRAAARSPRLDSFLLDRFLVEMPRRTARVAVDGEVVRLETPLHYRLAPGALRIVSSDEKSGVRSQKSE